MALGRNFHKSCGKDGGKVGENLAALRAAVFSLSSKNPRGGGRSNAPPPSRARVNKRDHQETTKTKGNQANNKRIIKIVVHEARVLCLFPE